jgi:hypothetical protein
MTRRKKWQSGAADLVSVAVGMVILSIAAAGTSAAMIYGREVLGREERYKSAAYMLKREVEKKQWELESYVEARRPGALGGRTLYTTQLQTTTERGEGSQPVMITFTQDPIIAVPDETYPTLIAYYLVTMRASWLEPDITGKGRQRMNRSLAFTTAVEGRY